MPLLTTIETFPLDAVKDEPVPTEIYGFEGLPEIVKNVLAECPVVLSLDSGSQLKLPFDGAFESQGAHNRVYTLRQATPEHRRSFIVEGGELGKPWQDEFDNYYGVFTLKGNNFTHSQLIETATAHDRYIGYGLQESAVIERVLRASDMLRRAGIGTEYIVGLAEPTGLQLRDNEVTVYHQPMDVIDYKRHLAEKFWRDLPVEGQSLSQFTEIFSKLERSTFYISMRATDTAYRYSDIHQYSEARRIVFEEANKRLGTQYDHNEHEDWERFTSEQFTPRLATNMARLHALGLAHRFPNHLNISAFGSIVDLDSVHGEPLGFGDDPITAEDIARDIFIATIDADTAGFDFHFRPKPDILEQFLPLYFEQYQQATGAEIDPNFKVAVLSELAKYAGEQKEYHSVFSSNNAQEIALKELASLALNVEKKDITKDWLEYSSDQLKADIRSYISDHAHTFATYMVMTLFHSFGDDMFKYGDDMFSYCFGENAGKLNNDNIVNEAVFGRLVSNVLADSYECYVQQNTNLLLQSADDTLTPVELTELVAQQIAEVFDDGQLVDSWLTSTMAEILPEFKDQLNTLTTIPDVDYVVIDEEQYNGIINVTWDNVLILESSGIPLQSLLDYARKHSVDVTINKPVFTPLSNDVQIGPAFTVPEGQRLIQVISDIQPDGYSVEYAVENELRAEGISADTEDQQYTVYVTVDTAGQKYFTLDINNSELIAGLKQASQAAIHAALATDSVGMAQLFDTSPYFERRFEEYVPRIVSAYDL